jgi:hypothetical protein
VPDWLSNSQMDDGRILTHPPDLVEVTLRTPGTALDSEPVVAVAIVIGGSHLIRAGAYPPFALSGSQASSDPPGCLPVEGSGDTPVRTWPFACVRQPIGASPGHLIPVWHVPHATIASWLGDHERGRPGHGAAAGADAADGSASSPRRGVRDTTAGIQISPRFEAICATEVRSA